MAWGVGNMGVGWVIFFKGPVIKNSKGGGGGEIWGPVKMFCSVRGGGAQICLYI